VPGAIRITKSGQKSETGGRKTKHAQRIKWQPKIDIIVNIF
jgi:hypothetical protein